MLPQDFYICPKNLLILGNSPSREHKEKENKLKKKTINPKIIRKSKKKLA